MASLKGGSVVNGDLQVTGTIDGMLSGTANNANFLSSHSYEQILKGSIKLNYINPSSNVQGWSLGNPSSHTVVIYAPSGNSLSLTTPSDNSQFAYGTLDGVIVRACGATDSSVYAEVFDYTPRNRTNINSTAGYTTMDNGIILQWGTVNSTSVDTDILFPIAFPTACVNMSATAAEPETSSAAETLTVYKSQTSTTGSKVVGYQNNSGSAIGDIYWFAIGY